MEINFTKYLNDDLSNPRCLFHGSSRLLEGIVPHHLVSIATIKIEYVDYKRNYKIISQNKIL